MTPNDFTYLPGGGIPLALPLGSSATAASSQVSELPEDFPGTETPLTSSSEHTGQVDTSTPVVRLSSKRLEALAAVMPERDHQVLQRIAEHRFLTTHQLQHFCFRNHSTLDSAARTARRVLARLERTGLIRPLRRRIGGVRAGSSAQIWQLAPGGARLLRNEGSQYRTQEPSLRFLAHCLAIADVHLVLLALARHEAIEQVDVQVESAAWRRYLGTAGEPRWLQPDLYARVQTADFIDRWFLEVDMATESTATILNQCAQYEMYRATGLEQDQHRSFPLVCWFFTDERRAQQVQTSLNRSKTLTPELYRFATPRTLVDVLSGGAV